MKQSFRKCRRNYYWTEKMEHEEKQLGFEWAERRAEVGWTMAKAQVWKLFVWLTRQIKDVRTCLCCNR